MVKKIMNLLSYPFRKHLSLLILLFLLISFFDIYGCIWQRRLFVFCVITRGFTDSYLLTLLYCIIPNTFKKWYLSFVLIILSIFYLIDLFIVIHFKTQFAEHIASVILGTNPSEAKEFLIDFVTWETVLIFFISILTSIILYKLSKRKSVVTNKIVSLASIALLFSFIINIAIPAPLYSTTLSKIAIFLKIQKAPNLADYYTNPSIEKIETQPKNIVLIIGESFSKKHSSLYGYNKQTNPYLEQFKQDSSLIIFNHIRSAYTGTAESFKGMMTTFRNSKPEEGKEWYTYTSLPEIIKKSSYYSYWISNQSYTGSFDNSVSRFADLCDTMTFVGKKFTTSCDRGPDELVLDPLLTAQKDSLNFFIVHLMGSHFSFKSRYPEHFDVFKESDYLDFPQHQRHNRATYDNSVLYNDSVVNEVIKIFKEREAIVLYFPDHSIDIYESSDDYCSHANRDNNISKEAGYNIPFMVFCSSAYQQKFPNKVNDLKNNINSHYSTEDIIYTLMDIMGVKFSNDNRVYENSLLHRNKP